MNQEDFERLKKLRKDIRHILCNRLTYPKTLLGLLRSPGLSEDQFFQVQETVDEAIRLVDAKFAEFFLLLEIQESAE